MDITQLAEISLESSAAVLLLVVAVKILRVKLDIKSSCLGNALQLESHNPGYRPGSPFSSGTVRSSASPDAMP